MKRALADRTFQPAFFIQVVFVFIAAALTLVLDFDLVAAAAAFAAAMVTGYALGIFHHMLFSHRAFKANTVVEFIGALLGTLSWRGPMAAPIRYAAMHRVHHEASDQENDPHSPIHGRWHAFMGWMWFFSPTFASPEQYEKIVPTLAKKKYLRFLDRNVHLVQLAYAVSVAVISYAIAAAFGSADPLAAALKYTAYFVFVKTAFVLTLANAVDVINHMGEEIKRGGLWEIFGYRNYETTDRSTNSLLMGMIHLGGAISWHNNHHAHPGYFVVKKRRWEIDIHYRMVQLLSLFGWTSDIKILDESTPSAGGTNATLRSLHTKSSARAAFMIANRLVVFAGVLALLIGLFTYPTWVTAIAAPLLFLVAGIALQNIGLIGHEGTHFNLAVSRLRSARIGNAVSSFVPFHLNTGFAISHSQHHKYANQDKDPDVQLFQTFDRPWKRMLLARSAASRAYMRKTINLARGHITEADLAALSFKEKDLQRLAIENILWAFLAVASYAGLIAVFKAPAVIALTGSFFAAILISGMRPYFEHAGTDQRRSHNARTFDGLFFNWAFGGINYHDAHHRYPGVPAYHAKNLEAFLRQSGGSGDVVTQGWSALLPLLSRKAYGSQDDLYATIEYLTHPQEDAFGHGSISLSSTDQRAQSGV